MYQKPSRTMILTTAIFDVILAPICLITTFVYFSGLVGFAYYIEDVVYFLFSFLLFAGMTAVLIMGFVTGFGYGKYRGEVYRKKMKTVCGLSIAKSVLTGAFSIMMVATVYNGAYATFLMFTILFGLTTAFSWVAWNQGRTEADPPPMPAQPRYYPPAGMQQSGWCPPAYPPMPGPQIPPAFRTANAQPVNPAFAPNSAPIQAPAEPTVKQLTFDDIVAQIGKLGELRAQGAITEEEFLRMKESLLGRVGSDGFGKN